MVDPDEARISLRRRPATQNVAGPNSDSSLGLPQLPWRFAILLLLSVLAKHSKDGCRLARRACPIGWWNAIAHGLQQFQDQFARAESRRPPEDPTVCVDSRIPTQLLSLKPLPKVIIGGGVFLPGSDASGAGSSRHGFGHIHDEVLMHPKKGFPERAVQVPREKLWWVVGR